MPKVKLTKDTTVKVKAGEIVNLDDAQVAMLIKTNRAEMVIEPKKAKKK